VIKILGGLDLEKKDLITLKKSGKGKKGFEKRLINRESPAYIILKVVFHLGNLTSPIESNVTSDQYDCF